MRVKFKTKLELIEHPDFESLNTEEIYIDGDIIPISILGEERDLEYYDNEEWSDSDEGYYWSESFLDSVCEFVEEDEIIDVDGDVLRYSKTTEEFTVGCKTIPRNKMVEIVNFCLDQLGYTPIKL